MTFIEAVPYLGIIAAAVMAFAIGANDVANALGTSVGSGALTIKKAIILGGIFEFLGTMIMGRFVTGTIKGGIVDTSVFEDNMDKFVLGMFCTLIAATIWLLVATALSLPVSTTHTVVGGIIGFAVVEKGFSVIQLQGIGVILLGWVVSPLMGCFISFVIYLAITKFIMKTRDPFQFAIKFLPIFAALTISILGVFIIVSEVPLLGAKIPVWADLLIFIGLFLISAPIIKFLVVPWYVKRFQYNKPGLPTTDEDTAQEGESLMADVGSPMENNPDQVQEEGTNEESNRDDEKEEFFGSKERSEEAFKALMILTAVFVAFAHGSNDVANAIGPAAALWEYKNNGKVGGSGDAVPFFLLLLGGIGIVIGLAVLGHRVMKTIGEKITKLTHSRGYSAQLATASTVMVASFFGLPISTTHTLVGSVTGISLVPGLHISSFW
eukprot:TRINITY_DN651_c0_g1_i1.p1 TRINITY_DN651_c0_g1~~TRINITY_DN651_c0_g1_i1.p1  ORF type:complete len:437 (+),score=114.26 TRINITY_DN651_c0_g1_i1:129-1439(+)